MPSFGYPLLRFDEDEEDQSPNKWNYIKSKMNPLKDMVNKQKKADNAFDIILKSFTYVRKNIIFKINL
jgi:hypothetical protein